MQIRLEKKRSLVECAQKSRAEATSDDKDDKDDDDDDDKVNLRGGYVLVGMRACNDFADRGKLSWMLGN